MFWWRRSEDSTERITALVSSASRLVRETATHVEACAVCPLYRDVLGQSFLVQPADSIQRRAAG